MILRPAKSPPAVALLQPTYEMVAGDPAHWRYSADRRILVDPEDERAARLEWADRVSAYERGLIDLLRGPV